MTISSPRGGAEVNDYAVLAMIDNPGAILAVAFLLATAGPLAEPRYVRFELADGVQVSGRMISWDAERFDGSFGPRFWEELVAADAWRLYLSVMDQNDASQWVDLGRVLLLSADGDSWAERAFRRALDLDSSVIDGIAAARRQVAEAQQLRQELEQTADAQRLETLSPESATWPADPWPPLTPSAQQAAILTMKAEAHAILRRAGRPVQPIETSHLLLYADAEPMEAARWAMRLEAVYSRLAGLAGVDDDHNIFWGKAAVVIFDSQDLFRLVQAESFGQHVSRRQLGICQPVGPKVFLMFRRGDDGEAVAAAMTHQMVHGFLHRYRTPRRLPAWANEGLAEYVAGDLAGRAVIPQLRQIGLEFIRGGGNVADLLDLTYTGGWPGPNRAGDAVGALLVELMITERPAGFRAWLAATKDGKDWRQALKEDFGVPLDQLLATFVRYYRVND